MIMARFILWLSFSFCAGGISFAQSLDPLLPACAGTDFTSGIAMLSFSVGEPAIESWLLPTRGLTEGFQQPNLLLATQYPPSPVRLSLQVWPNPFSETLQVSAPSECGPLKLSVIQALGVCLETHQLSDCSDGCTLPMGHLSAGSYFIQIVDQNEVVWGNWKMIRL